MWFVLAWPGAVCWCGVQLCFILACSAVQFVGCVVQLWLVLLCVLVQLWFVLALSGSFFWVWGSSVLHFGSSCGSVYWVRSVVVRVDVLLGGLVHFRFSYVLFLALV